MREAAYVAFLRDSEELHRAHHTAAEPSRILLRLRWMLHVLLAILYWQALPFPERPAGRGSEPAAAVRATGSRTVPAPSPVPRLPRIRFESHHAARGAQRRVIGGEAR